MAAGRGSFGSSLQSRRAHLSLLGSAAVAMFGAGCSALSGSQGSSSGGGSGNNNLEKSSLRVAELPIIDCAAINVAQERGYFKDEGLSVEIIPAQGGSVILPQLVSGDLDFGWTNWPSLFLAQSQGVSEFQVISGGFEAGTKTLAITAKANGNIREAKDLAGKTIAVNTFKNIAELAARSTLQVAGVDHKSVKFVEIGFPEMPAALDAGQVDAVTMNEPFITSAERDSGAKVILDCATGPTEGIPIAGIVATKKFTEENPNTAAAFRRAIDKAQRSLADRQVVEQIVPTYVNVDEQTTKLLRLGNWPTSINRIRLQRVADLMLQFDVLKEKFDIAPLLPKSTA